MKDGFEMDGPFLAIGRQSKGLGLEDFECEASSSHWPVSDRSGNNVCAKKSRIDDGEFWHRDDNAGGSFGGEFSQVQALPGSQRPQQENCTEMFQGHWNALSCNGNNLNESGPGLSMTTLENETILGHSSRSGLFGYCEATESGPTATGCDFLQTGSEIAGNSPSASFLSGWVAGNGSNEISFSAGSAVIEDKVGSWNGLAGLHAAGAGVPDTSASMSCFANVSGFEGKNGRDLIVNLVQSPGNMDHQNTAMQAPLNRIIGDNSGTAAEAENMYLRAGVGEGICLDPNICSYSLSPPEADSGKALFHIGNLASSSVDHSDNKVPCRGTGGRRSSCKRKMSTPVIANASCFQGPQVSAKRESNTTRTSGGSGSSRTNPNAMSCTAIPDVLLSTSASSMIQMQDDRRSGSSGFVGNENDLYEALRGSAGKPSSLGGASGGIHRTVRNRPVSSHQEQSHSQLHSLFARNLRRSMPVQSQALFSRSPSAEQSGDIIVNGANNTSALHESDHWAPAFGQGSSISSTVPGLGGTNPVPTGNIMLASFVAPVRERISGMFEGNRMRSMSSRSSSWAGTATSESTSTNLTSASRGVSGSMPRAMNPLEAIAQTSHVANSIFYPSMDSSSRISALFSNGRNSGGLGRNRPPPVLPSMTTHNPAPFGSSVEVIPSSSGMHSGPSSTVSRPPLFMDGQGGVVAAPIHSILGMPLRGLHILTADRENRQRFVSEILSALEHARRNEDLTFEELVMLDPSLIYGGIDMHDQHSDMRMDVDNMSYEELLALEERIGNVSTGLTDETISKCLRESKYSSLDATVAVISQESDRKCTICQEEYVEEDELGRLDCGHGYHTICIKQWLLQKNQCPVCKAAAYSNS